MNAMKKEHTDPGPELLGMLASQVRLYGQLQQLADKQRSLISNEDPEPLLAVLAHRRRLTEDLMAVNRRMAGYRSAWDEIRASLAPQDRDTADALVREARSRLERLLSGDEQDARMLRVRKQRVSGDLNAVNAGSRAMSAYKDAQASQQVTFDQTHVES